ncbi:hypothetical protein HA466_0218500 [Hirschfeldia incana]|nr:hypothetical protein HA466_0218500 [Hirschfeldia incana]
MATEIEWDDSCIEATYTCTCGSNTLLAAHSCGKVYLRVPTGFEYPEVTLDWNDKDIRVHSTCPCGSEFLFRTAERRGRFHIK